MEGTQLPSQRPLDINELREGKVSDEQLFDQLKAYYEQNPNEQEKSIFKLQLHKDFNRVSIITYSRLLPLSLVSIHVLAGRTTALDALRCMDTNDHRQSQPSQQEPASSQQSRTC